MDCAYCSFSNKKSIFFSDGSQATVSADKKILAFSITFFLLAAGSACAVYFTGSSYYCYSGPAATGLISLTLIVVSLVRLNPPKEKEVPGWSPSPWVSEGTLRKALVQECDDQEEFRLLLKEIKRQKIKALKYENIAFLHQAPTSSMICFGVDGKIYHVKERFFNNPEKSIVFIFSTDSNSLKFKKAKAWPVVSDRPFLEAGGQIKILDKRNGFQKPLRKAVSLIAE